VSVPSPSLYQSPTLWVTKNLLSAGTLPKIHTWPDRPPSSPYRKNWRSNCQRATEHL
jgi:hypothetical protein